MGGDGDTPNMAQVLPHQSFDGSGWGVSARVVFDLQNRSNSKIILPPGQSGRIGDDHYDDKVQMWMNGQYDFIVIDQETINGLQNVIHLLPKHN